MQEQGERANSLIIKIIRLLIIIRLSLRLYLDIQDLLNPTRNHCSDPSRPFIRGSNVIDILCTKRSIFRLRSLSTATSILSALSTVTALIFLLSFISVSSRVWGDISSDAPLLGL